MKWYEMKQSHGKVIFFLMGVILFGISMLFLIVGKRIYGNDASLLWASGIMSYLGLKAIVYLFIDEEKTSKEGKK